MDNAEAQEILNEVLSLSDVFDTDFNDDDFRVNEKEPATKKQLFDEKSNKRREADCPFVRKATRPVKLQRYSRNYNQPNQP